MSRFQQHRLNASGSGAGNNKAATDSGSGSEWLNPAAWDTKTQMGVAVGVFAAVTSGAYYLYARYQKGTQIGT